jgi:hypothetical protein
MNGSELEVRKVRLENRLTSLEIKPVFAGEGPGER